MYDSSQASNSPVGPVSYTSVAQPFLTELERRVLAYLETTDRNASGGKSGSYKSTLLAAAQFFQSQDTGDDRDYSKVLGLIQGELRNLEYLERVKGMVLQA